MICKRDLISWFQELESYNRIDIMCTLLNMCLPFELRFLGTCLEDLGRRDSQELRGIELRVNNPQELASDMIACQKGEPTDKKIRRKMALYLALIRACNRICVTEIFRTLDGWGECDFLNMNDVDTLQELLLVYTMAANHPVFSFEQHMKCTDIFKKIRKNKLLCNEDVTTTSASAALTTTIPHLTQQLEQTLTIVAHPDMLQQMQPPPSHPHTIDYLQQNQQQTQQQQQHTVQTLHIAGQNSQLLTPTQIQMVPQPPLQNTISMNYLPTHLTKLMPGDGNVQHPADMTNLNIPTDTATLLTHANVAAWPQYPITAQTIDHQPQTNSPLLSQQSSPASSRATSPSRSSNASLTTTTLQQGRSLQQRIGSSLKNLGRPPSDTTPPPQQNVSNEVILPHTLKNMEEIYLTTDQGSGSQLQTLIRNGFTRTGHHPRLKAGSYLPPTHHQLSNQQQQQQQHFSQVSSGTFAVNSNVSYAIQNMPPTQLTDTIDLMPQSHNSNMDNCSTISNKSVGSDSGSSIGSAGDISPPETPTLITGGNHNSNVGNHHNYSSKMNLHRINGGGGGRNTDKLIQNNIGNTGGIAYAAVAPTVSAQQQNLYSNDIIFTPHLNATANLLQTTLVAANNNNNGGNSGNGGGGVNSNNVAAVVNTPNTNLNSNNNMTSNAIQINSSSNAQTNVLLQSQQQSYPYPAPSPVAAHLTSTSAAAAAARQPLMAPPPPPPQQQQQPQHATYHRIPSFPIATNGDVIYVTNHHPVYMPTPNTTVQPQPPQQQPSQTIATALRNSTSGNINANATTAVVLTTTAKQGTSAIIPINQYSTLSISKPMSCYNCGSNTHIGRDCSEASMDDVTRNANYKLDYSVSAALSPTIPLTPTSTTNNGGQTNSTSATSLLQITTTPAAVASTATTTPPATTATDTQLPADSSSSSSNSTSMAAPANAVLPPPAATINSK